MSDTPPNNDEQHLKILSVCYYVSAGFGVMVFILSGLVFLISGSMNAGSLSNMQSLDYIVVSLVLVFLFCPMLVFNVLAGRFIAKRKHRTFTLIVAGLNCLSFSLSTVVGIFTFMTLNRASVKELYEQADDVIVVDSPDSPKPVQSSQPSQSPKSFYN